LQWWSIANKRGSEEVCTRRIDIYYPDEVKQVTVSLHVFPSQVRAASHTASGLGRTDLFSQMS
jgi:hypothetical protein